MKTRTILGLLLIVGACFCISLNAAPPPMSGGGGSSLTGCTNVAGALTCTSFTGDGSGLTGLAATDNTTIDSRIDQDHADSNATSGGTRSDVSVTPAGLASIIGSKVPGIDPSLTNDTVVCVNSSGKIGDCSNLTWDGNEMGLNGSILLGGKARIASGENYIVRIADGANASGLKWYYFLTDATNYQYGYLSAGSNYVKVSADSNGTGADNIDIVLTPLGTGVVKTEASFSGALNGTVGATTPAAGAFTTITVGDGNFTSDEFGNITFKSAGVNRTDEPQYVKLYEATSKGNKWVMFKAPEDGFLSDDNTTYGGNETTYYWPRRRPTYGAGYMSLMFPSIGTGQSASIGEWMYGLYVTAPFSGLLKTSGTNNAISATAGTDYLSPTGNETIINKAFVMHRVALGGGNATLTSAQVSGKIFDNTGQHLANIAHTLPTAATGNNFIAEVGEGQSVAAYWKIKSATANICLDGTCGKTYIQQAQPVYGSVLRCATAWGATGGVTSSATLAVGTDPTQVKTAAFGYDIAGVYYAKAAVDGTAPGDDVIPEDLYGAVAFDIDANGTIDVIEATANATGYATAVLALAGLPAAASDHVRIGTVTAMKSDGAFTFGTTSLADAAVAEAYTSTAVYTKGYVWMCDSTVGTWTTD